MYEKVKVAILGVFLFLSGTVAGEIANGDFELSEPNLAYGINVPVGWDFENFADVSSSEFVPQPEHGQGGLVNWTIPGAYRSDSYVLLSTGDIEPDIRGTKIKHAHITQEYFFTDGHTLKGVYFFGTCDWDDYPDYGRIVLIPDPNSGLQVIELVYVDVTDVGSYGSTEGWQRFTHTFSAQDSGWYTIKCKVADYDDTIYKSYLAVDAFMDCQDNCAADIDFDCRVDYNDFGVFAYDWGRGNDPNYPITGYTDLNEDGLVDEQDLSLMLDSWLGCQ